MNTIKHFISAAMLTTIAMHTTAQNEVDALRYSLSQTPVSARSFGMGGAFGALGADLSSFFTNPAGVGAYKRGGIEFSLGLNDYTSLSTYMNNATETSGTRLTLNNIGLVGSQQTGNKDWKTINFGVAYAKTNNFYQDISINGTSTSSLMYPFSLQAGGISPEGITDALPYTTGLAYQTYAINPTDSLGTFYIPANTDGDVKQSKYLKRSGAQAETSFAFGTSFRDILLIGGAINFQSVRFREKSTYHEEFDTDQPISSLSYTEDLVSDGTGVNLKLGVIVKPTKWLRAGVAYHTASRIGLHETWSTGMSSKEKTGQAWEMDSSQPLVTDYSIRTPSRLQANTAFVLGKAGVVSADYEYTNFNRMRLNGSSTNNYDYAAENDVIRTIYRSTHKFRMGVEMRMFDNYYVRGGAVYQQNPFSINVGAVNNPFITYTGGVGYHGDYFFADFALGYTQKDETYYMYDPSYVEPANIHTARTTALLSFGFRY